MPPSEGGEGEEAAPVDIRSRIAAFSQQGSAASTPTSTSSSASASRPAPAVSRISKPTLRKTPSTSQLLPAWQQHQQQERQKQENGSSSSNNVNNAFLKPSSAAPSSRQRAYTGDESRSAAAAAAGNDDASTANSPKLGVKSIIALYGQQTQNISGDSASLHPRSREVSSDGLMSAGQLSSASSSRATSIDTLRRAVPPPSLPPRPRMNNAILSQTNTGSSDRSTSSNSLSTSAAVAIPPSSYVPYTRKGNGSFAGSPIGAESSAPALPRRLGATQSVEDLGIEPTTSSQLTAAMRKLGTGPKWASSSSENLITQGENSRSQSPTMPPAVPPRISASATASVANSPSSSVVPPPPKRNVVPHSPSAARKNARSATTATSAYTTSMPSSGTGTSAASMATSPSSDYTPRSARSSIQPPKGNGSPLIAPPRHVDIRRMDPRTAGTASSASSLRNGKKKQARRKRNLKAGAVYTRDPGDAEQRYTLLFYRRLKEQQARTGGDTSLLNKRTVVRIWKQSQLEDAFLAKVWAETTTTDDAGIGRVAFARAMSAIDNELSRRQTERQGRTATLN